MARKFKTIAEAEAAFTASGEALAKRDTLVAMRPNILAAVDRFASARKAVVNLLKDTDWSDENEHRNDAWVRRAAPAMRDFTNVCREAEQAARDVLGTEVDLTATPKLAGDATAFADDPLVMRLPNATWQLETRRFLDRAAAAAPRVKALEDACEAAIAAQTAVITGEA